MTLTSSLKALRARLSFQLDSTIFVLVFAVLNGLLFHFPLYTYAMQELPAHTLTEVQALLSLFVVILLLTLLFLFLFALISQRLLKPLIILIILSNAIALYFIQAYQVVLDKAMMGNVFNTNPAEAGSYFSAAFLLHLFLYGVLPAWLVTHIQIKQVSRVRTLIVLIISVLGCAGTLYANAQSWLWIDKHASKLGGMILPWSYTINAGRYQLEKHLMTRELALLPPAHFATQDNKKTVVVLVIGESARAANFSLYGYPVETNPLLKQAGAVAIQHAHACATYTTAAVQCILAHVDTSSTLIHNYEALPSYLQRHGIDTTWVSHNWGEPPLKVNTYLNSSDLRGACKGSHCDFDEVMLTGLAERIKQSPSQRVFVVLHQAGSHGPDYYNHYPADGEKFTPVCRSVNLQDCSPEAVIHGYDNTILYTDRFLAETIKVLKSIPDAETAMLYISDHGESLGEFGLYLHGTPYALAPDVQKDVPYIVWTSDSFKQRKTLAPDAAIAHAQHADQTLFHSVMGAFDMQSDIYDPQLDIFTAARASKGSAK